MQKFTHLHTHTAYSLRDGVGKIDEYLNHLKEDGQTSLALTEHGNMFSHINFYTEAKKVGIKPIFGVEAYNVKDRFARGQASDIAGQEKKDFDKTNPRFKKRAWHSILLAQNYTGYKNLMKLVTFAGKEGYYYNPRMDKKLIAENSEGIIATSACLGGEINQAIIYDDYDWAEEAIKEYIDIFGTDRFFLEVQNHELPEEEKVRAIIPKFAKKFGLKIIATNDTHYCKEEDKIVQDAVKALDAQTTLDDPKLQERLYKTNHFYLKTRSQMAKMFKGNEEWLENAYNLGESCNVELKYDKIAFPEFVKGDDRKKALLRELCVDGYNKLIAPIVKPENKKEYGDRVKYELDVINKNGFADYFLIVQDIVNAARAKGIPMGKGRGSVGGALIAYLLGITKIDSIKYGLYFERFLNPSRISPPDIDLDFADVRRDEVIEYTREKYGENQFAKTLTFGNFQPRMALRDSFRVYGHDVELQNEIAKLVPEVIQGIPNLRFKHLYGQNPDFPQAIQPELLAMKEKYPKEFWLAERLEGNPRHVSTHASAYILADKPIWEYVPMDYDAKNKCMRVGVDMYSADKAKLLKMDFLGIETLTIVDNAKKDILERHNIKIDDDTIPLDDQKTWDLISRGETIGIFQFESDGIRNLLKKARPRTINELADCNAIYRPGAAKFIDEYCAVKHGLKDANPIHPLMEPILKETHGVLIMQEQIMKMCQVLAGFTLPEADYMRKAIGKKKEEDMVKLIPMFEEGCKKNGIDINIIAKILDWFHDMSRYNFNKAHAVGYSLDAYCQAYVKANYPLEFARVMLNKKTVETSEYLIRISDIKRKKIKVHGPSINNSEAECSIKDNEIYFGLNLIKGTGSKTIDSIIELRKENKRDFESYLDLINLCKEFIDKRTLSGLVTSGALDEIHVNRKWALENMEEQLKQIKKMRIKDKNQIDLFGEEDTKVTYADCLVQPTDYEDSSIEVKLAQEREVVGFYASSNPLDPYKHLLFDDEILTTSEAMASRNDDDIQLAAFVKSVRRFKDKNGEEMAFVEVEDELGVAKCVMFAKKYRALKSRLKEMLPVMIKGRLSNGSIIINTMEKLEDLCNKN